MDSLSFWVNVDNIELVDGWTNVGLAKELNAALKEKHVKDEDVVSINVSQNDSEQPSVHTYTVWYRSYKWGGG